MVRYLLSSLSYGVVECSASGLARQLGISRASVYRAFQDLEQAGLIRRRDGPSSSPIRPLWRVSGAPVRKFPLRCTNPVNDPSLPRIGVSIQI